MDLEEPVTLPETVGIWEFNNLPDVPGTPLPDGTVIPDVSGNGLDATVEANVMNALAHGEGDGNLDRGPNRTRNDPRVE